MNAEELCLLANARGIDLKFTASSSSDTGGAARERRLTKEERGERIPSVRLTARGKETARTRRAAFTHAELGMGAGNLGPVPWSAALLVFACSTDGIAILWNALTQEALRLTKRENWAIRVAGEDGRLRFFQPDLAMLVLDAELHKSIFVAAPVLYPAYMYVREDVWADKLHSPFRALQGVLDRWVSIARYQIGRQICGGEN